VRPENGIEPGDDARTRDYLAVMYAGVVLGAVVAEGIGGVADVQQPNPRGGAAGREVIGAGAGIIAAADLIWDGGSRRERHEWLRLPLSGLDNLGCLVTSLSVKGGAGT
jgi:hypothetical protein